MENIKVLHSQLGDDHLCTARYMTDDEKKSYADWCRDRMMLMTSEPIYLRSLLSGEIGALAHIVGKELIGYFPGTSGRLYVVTDEEWDALIAANHQAAVAKAAKERAERTDYLRTCLRRADAQRVDGKLPTAAEAREKGRKWNNVYNEGGEGYVPHYYSQKEYDYLTAELAALTSDAEKETENERI